MKVGDSVRHIENELSRLMKESPNKPISLDVRIQYSDRPFGPTPRHVRPESFLFRASNGNGNIFTKELVNE